MEWFQLSSEFLNPIEIYDRNQNCFPRCLLKTSQCFQEFQVQIATEFRERETQENIMQKLN